MALLERDQSELDALAYMSPEEVEARRIVYRGEIKYQHARLVLGQITIGDFVEYQDGLRAKLDTLALFSEGQGFIDGNVEIPV